MNLPGTNRYKCLMPDCDWTRDFPIGHNPRDAETAIRTHMEGHDDHSVLECLRARIADQREQQPAAEDAQTPAAGLDNATGRKPRSTVDQLRAELLIANRNAHTADAERAEAQAALLSARAEVERARAREARIHAAAAADRAALAEVRRLCSMTIEGSMRVQARVQAEDTLAVIDRVTARETTPADGAWGTVWLEGDWRWITSRMTTEQREYAADCVARWSASLAEQDGDLEREEPTGLRWWRDSAAAPITGSGEG